MSEIEKRRSSKSKHSYDENEHKKRKKTHKKDYEEIENTNNKSVKKKKKSKLRVVIRIFLVLLILIAICAGVFISYVYDKLNKIERHDIDKNEIEINEGVETTGYFNILLLGVDARDQDNSYEESLSDTIMIVSINQDTKKVRIASVYRDTYLQITGRSFDKVTHAFLLGGPKLSMSTINTNLDLDITDYVAINFNVVVDLIDAVGGLTIDLTEEEVSYINPYIQEMNEKTKKNSEWIYRGGTYLLDGVQATAYARIRYTSGGDWKRTERQREVLGLVFQKLKTMSFDKLNKIADMLLKQVSTNVETKQILYLLSQAPKYEIEAQTGWPNEVVDYKPAKIWYGPPRNLALEVKELHKFLFDKEDYVVSSKVQSISNAMQKKTGIK